MALVGGQVNCPRKDGVPALLGKGRAEDRGENCAQHSSLRRYPGVGMGSGKKQKRVRGQRGRLDAGEPPMGVASTDQSAENTEKGMGVRLGRGQGVDGGGWDQGQGRQACVPGCARIVEKSGPMPVTSGTGQRMGSSGSTWNYRDGREEL